MSSRSQLQVHRDEIAEALRNGVSQSELARRYNVARSTLQFFIRRHIEERDVDPLSSDPTASFTEIPVFERHYPDQDCLYVYPLGDVHIGSPAHARDRWLEWLNYLAENEKASLLGTGDFLNSALKDSVSDVYDETLTVSAAKRQLRDDLRRLAEQDQIDLLMPGNHEARIHRAIGDCPIQDVAEWYGVHYARDAAVLVYYVGCARYEVYVRHGTGAGQVGARANRLAQQARTLIADVYVSGHTHSQLVFPQDLFVVENGRVVRRKQTFVSSGSFLNYEGYAARAGYAPQRIGAPRIRLDGTRKDVHVSI